MRFLNALGLSDCDVERTEPLPGVTEFVQEVSRIWRDENPIYAFGLHFALEYLASSLHGHFARGLDKYPFLRDYDKEYFNYHKTAEKIHADFSERGFLQYATDEESRVLLAKGVDKAIELMKLLWDDFYKVVFPTEPACVH
jgi:pyrroloquinoline quinone (PQQ) biosynthesis protein C